VFPLVFVILFLSSAFFPENLLLEPAKSIAEWNPLSLIADGIRDPIISDVSLRPTLEALAGIALIAGIGSALSVWGLRSRIRDA
jgi:ABC-2 type transport system permease protein